MSEKSIFKEQCLLKENLFKKLFSNEFVNLAPSENSLRSTTLTWSSITVCLSREKRDAYQDQDIALRIQNLEQRRDYILAKGEGVNNLIGSIRNKIGSVRDILSGNKLVFSLVTWNTLGLKKANFY